MESTEIFTFIFMKMIGPNEKFQTSVILVLFENDIKFLQKSVFM